MVVGINLVPSFLTTGYKVQYYFVHFKINNKPLHSKNNFVSILGQIFDINLLKETQYDSIYNKIERFNY